MERTCKSWVDESGLALLVLRYEDMLGNAIFNFGKAIEFIGLDFHEILVERRWTYAPSTGYRNRKG